MSKIVWRRTILVDKKAGPAENNKWISLQMEAALALFVYWTKKAVSKAFNASQTWTNSFSVMSSSSA